MSPYVVAQHLHSPALILGAWVTGGVAALLGAFIYAEIEPHREPGGAPGKDVRFRGLLLRLRIPRSARALQGEGNRPREVLRQARLSRQPPHRPRCRAGQTCGCRSPFSGTFDVAKSLGKPVDTLKIIGKTVILRCLLRREHDASGARPAASGSLLLPDTDGRGKQILSGILKIERFHGCEGFRLRTGQKAPPARRRGGGFSAFR